MRIVGVICEYNPFHNGHAWQLREIRRRFGADTAVICAMSGNFVQRGECAILRKHVRAEAAVSGGADLVLEVPLPWAISSAEGFARGGIGVLRAAGLVDTLAFGSECADTEKLMRVARGLDSQRFGSALKAQLDKGISFASARQAAAKELLGDDACVLSDPNDILGVEYCKALLRSGSSIVPAALPRNGTAHDGTASASDIRMQLLAGNGADGLWTQKMSQLYRQEQAAGRAPVTLRTLERAALFQLRAMEERGFAACDESGEGLYHRFYDASRTATSLEGLLDAVKTKRYAHARLRRMLLMLLLGVRPEDAAGEPPYLRVLAMNDKGKYLLHEMRKTALVPVLTKPADVRELPERCRSLFALECRATDQYVLAYPALSCARGGSEWTTGPVILDGGMR